MNALKCCSFTGHRAEKLPWKYNENDPRCAALKLRIADVIRSLYDAGCRRFICGMATGCDMYFAEAVIALRSERGDVILEAAIPFEGQSAKWAPALRKRYFRLAEECDFQTVLHQNYTADCMMDRNCYMVDHSEILVAAYNGSPGGTQATMLYALRQNRQIIEIPVEGPSK